MKSVGKSDFGELIKYITDKQNKNERVGYVYATNCQTDKHQVAITEVLNTQAQNTRATSDKTYHLIVSFRAGEQPDDATLRVIEARICEGLDFGEHQRVSAVHHDTDNLHIHIAINKIHPTRYTIHDPYNDHKTLGQLCEKLEREFGLQVDNHRAQKCGAENRAGDMERHAGVQSLLGWIKRECADEIKGAQSWTELHAVMQSNGLMLQERGNGLVITDGAGVGVKASSVARELSKVKLEQRFGAFEALPTRAASVAAAQAQRNQSTPVAKIGSKPPPRSQNRLHNLSQLEPMQINSGRRYEQKPMRSRVNTVELYAKYKNEQQTSNASRTLEWSKAIDRKNRHIEAAKRSGRLKRAAIKVIKGPGLGKKIMYAATSETLKNEIQKINKQYLAERQAIYDKYQRLAWADWLRVTATDGDREALGALRARDAAKGLKGNTVAGNGGLLAPQNLPQQDSITKQGTIIYRFGSTAVRDDGDKLTVSRNTNLNGLQAALRFAIKRYGDQINVSGTESFKEQIVQAAVAAKLTIIFADATLERRRQELLQSVTTKETGNEHNRARPAAQPGARTDTKQPRADRGRADSSSNGRAGLAAADINAIGAGRAGGRQFWPVRGEPVPGGGLPGKPDIGRVGRKPPPQSTNCLRGLSELGVVQLASGSQVLLPRDVSGYVEQQGAKSDHGLRWDVSGTARVTGGPGAADKYIAERMAMQVIILDIPNHIRYDKGHEGPAAYAGTRWVEGQALALLKRGEEVLVMPVDDATARRLKRVAVGDVVTITLSGSVKTKGRSR